jgi:hypothetical protein
VEQVPGAKRLFGGRREAVERELGARLSQGRIGELGLARVEKEKACHAPPLANTS